jgi:hypothetical protein
MQCRFFGLRRAVQNYIDTIHRKIRIRRARASRPALIVARRFPSGALTASCRCQAACPCRWTSPLLPSSPFVSTASTAIVAIVESLHQKQVIIVDRPPASTATQFSAQWLMHRNRTLIDTCRPLNPSKVPSNRCRGCEQVRASVGSVSMRCMQPSER